MRNVIASLYSTAKMRVRCHDGHTRFFYVSLGALQGEILSPLLFALYVSDIDKFLVNKG